MTRTEAYKRLLELATAELMASQHSYHNYIPPEVTALLQEAFGAKPKRLTVIVSEVEARLKDKGFPPGLR